MPPLPEPRFRLGNWKAPRHRRAPSACARVVGTTAGRSAGASPGRRACPTGRSRLIASGRRGARRPVSARPRSRSGRRAPRGRRRDPLRSGTLPLLNRTTSGGPGRRDRPMPPGRRSRARSGRRGGGPRSGRRPDGRPPLRQDERSASLRAPHQRREDVLAGLPATSARPRSYTSREATTTRRKQVQDTRGFGELPKLLEREGACPGPYVHHTLSSPSGSASQPRRSSGRAREPRSPPRSAGR